MERKVSKPSNYLQLYTTSHDDAIAIETMTGVSDSFNNGIGLKKLNLGEKFNVKWVLKISSNQKQHE
jgi:aldose 1-epimerase